MGEGGGNLATVTDIIVLALFTINMGNLKNFFLLITT